MPTSEPTGTALLLTICGVLLAVSVLSSRASQRIGVPIALFFLVVGILAGSEGIGGIPFSDFRLAFRMGTLALTLILFDGGLNTPLEVVRRVWAPAGVLAFVGVVLMAGLVAGVARLGGLEWPAALVLGAIVSSTDAAATFAVLRASGLQLKRRVAATLEVESGVNDPAAVILTMTLALNLVRPGELQLMEMLLGIVTQLLIGAVIGIGAGYLGRALISRLHLVTGGLYPALLLAFGLLSFGVATLAQGSGFLAVYLTGIVLGNGPLPYRAGLFRIFDALAWLSQIGMFLMLGLLVFPSRLGEMALLGVIVALLLALVIRPLVVALCLAPFRYPRNETLFIGWVGLRGAVPIVLATFPVLVGAPGADRIFHLVFFIVVLSAIIPGATVAWATRRLGLESREPPAPHAVLAIESRVPLLGELVSFYIDDALVVCGLRLDELDFPEGASVALVVRGDQLVPPKGGTVLRPGDHVYVVVEPEDRPLIQLMFGRPEEG
ncbi:MAG: potassium/proton antiporter [Gemmatimonadales bacterium]|nr:potassium/proton antiporter [Gemmatimonadales bacterium]